jgi:O-antigen ligase
VMVIVLALASIFLMIKAEYFNLRRKQIAIFVTGLCAVGIIVFVIAGLMGSGISQRFSSLNLGQDYGLEAGTTNSMISRLMIWDTALHAYHSSPIVGIGMYSFPYSSRRYSALPDFLYDDYVYSVTPHLGYLTVLTETGIIGMIGFLYLLIGILRISYKAHMAAVSDEQKYVVFTVSMILIYIMISLGVSDAWFSDSGIMIWGVFLGLLGALIKNILTVNHNKVYVVE